MNRESHVKLCPPGTYPCSQMPSVAAGITKGQMAEAWQTVGNSGAQSHRD